MAIEVVTVPYEILIRFKSDGSIRGAHYKELQIIRDGSFVYQEKEGDAMPLALGSAQMQLALGEVTAGYVQDLASAQHSLLTVQTQLEVMTESHQVLATQLDIANSNLASSTQGFQAQIAAFKAQLAVANQRIAELEAITNAVTTEAPSEE